MASILHCGGRRRAEAFWLFPTDEDKLKLNALHEVVLKADCPCGLSIMERYLITETTVTPADRIKQKNQESWLAQINSRLNFKVEPRARELKDTRAKPIVSEFTKLLSLPTDRAYRKILERVS